MSSPWSIATATISNPTRGPGQQQQIDRLGIQSLSFTWSWGSQPAQGAITYVSNGNLPRITYGAWVQIEVFGKTFYGVVQRGATIVQEGLGMVALPTERSSSGNTLRLDILDPRTYLRWDQVFCAFNILDIRVVNGVRVRRYKHLLPENFLLSFWTYTTGPVSAAFIISKILSFTPNRFPRGGTIQTQWVCSSILPNGTYRAGKVNSPAFHPDQIEFPVYNIDCTSGKYLDEVLQEISDAQGLLFTLQDGPFNLVWCRKGDGVLPAFPENSDNQQISQALSQNPTRMYVVGDRNRYLCLDLVMIPDWNRAWEEILTVDGLMQDLFDFAIDPISGQRYNAMADDPEHAIGYQLAAERAREITVREYAAFRMSFPDNLAEWRDFRFFSGRSRMDMPAALYLDTIVFRAFRPPDFVNLKGESVPTIALELVDDLFARVFLNSPTNPKMNVDLTTPPAGNGFAIARGYNIGNEVFKAISPDRFNLNDFLEVTNLWQQVTFQIDESFENGRYIILDEKMINPAGLFVDKLVENNINPGGGDFLNGYSVLRADPIISVPEVRAALVFEADKFVLTYTTGIVDSINATRDDKINENGLYQEVIQELDGTWKQMPYADGLIAEQKAIQIASVLCKRPYWYYQGGFKWKLRDGDVIPDLNGMINRISVEYSPSGHICDLEFANGRPEPVYRQEREYDRRRRWISMLPGQQELRDQARYIRMAAAAFKQTPQLARKAEEFLRGKMGQDVALEPCVIIEGSGGLRVGTPLWGPAIQTGDDGKKMNTRAVMPSVATASHPVFRGVTVRQNEDSSGKFYVQRVGTMLARVKGPIEPGDLLTQSQNHDYFEKASGGSSDLVAAKSMEKIADDSILLIMAVAPGGGGAGGSVPTPEQYDKTKEYSGGKLVYRAKDEEWDDGREVGLWIALKTVPVGDPPGSNGPSLDNIPAGFWAIYAPEASASKTVRVGKQLISIDAGRGGYLPRIKILSDTTDDATSPSKRRCTIDLTDIPDNAGDMDVRLRRTQGTDMDTGGCMECMALRTNWYVPSA